MISLTGDKIVNHVSRFIDSKREESQQKNGELNEIRDRCGKLKSEMKDIAGKLDQYVSKDEIESLITDIRESFELFMNQTPRTKDNETDDKIFALQSQLDEMNNKLDALGLNNIEIVPKKRAIPKLDVGIKLKSK